MNFVQKFAIATAVLAGVATTQAKADPVANAIGQSAATRLPFSTVEGFCKYFNEITIPALKKARLDANIEAVMQDHGIETYNGYPVHQKPTCAIKIDGKDVYGFDSVDLTVAEYAPEKPFNMMSSAITSHLSDADQWRALRLLDPAP